MATISQMLSVSFPEVLAAMRRPENQWSDSSFMDALDKGGFIEKVSGSNIYEVPVDYKMNPAAEFQATDLDTVSTTKTDVITTAQYTAAQFQIPVVWSRKDEAENSSPNQKVALVKSLIENVLTTHDDTIEDALFDADTNGFLGLPTVIPSGGQGTVGTIDAGTEVWWRNYSGTYASNYSDLLAKMTVAHNTIAKGSGSSATPKLIVMNQANYAGYEATQTTYVRYMDSRKADAGFTSLVFKNTPIVFSQYASTSIYFLNPKSFKLIVVKNAFRSLGETIEFTDAAGYIRKLYSLLQTKVSSKSRLGVLVPA